MPPAPISRPTGRTAPERLPWLGLLVLLWALLLAPAVAVAAPGTALVLSPWTPEVEGWPAVRVLADPDEALDADAARAALPRFERPGGPYGNLGPRRGATWLHVRLDVAEDAPARWVLRFVHPILHRATVHLYDAGGRLVSVTELGTRIPFTQREQQTRSLATELRLEPGRPHELLLRVATRSSQMVAFGLLQPAALAAEEAEELALQGLMNGLWLFMAVYCLIQWMQQRNRLMPAYGGALASTWLFMHALYGTGPMVLWPDNAWLAMNMSALAPLLGVAANTRFFIAALGLRTRHPGRARVFDGIGLAALALAALFATGSVGYRTTSTVAMALALAHLLLALGPAYADARRGDHAAGFLLAGWSVNVIGVLQISTLLLGHLPVSHISLHVAQYAFACEMTTWLVVLGLRVQQMRRQVDDERQRSERLDAQAHTDALTGLLNRRGLDRALGLLPQGATMPTGRRVLYMLDLDGFKPVNDRWGHEAGDLLLRQVSLRLRHAVRPDDVVARLGGDEFVVVCSGIDDCEAAARVGAKLLAQFEAPFDLGDGRLVPVGATIGCARDGRAGADTATLLRRADAAMYAGKQSGKGRLSTCEDVTG